MRLLILVTTCILSFATILAAPRARVYYDLAHGEMAPGDAVQTEARALNLEVTTGEGPISADRLKGVKLLYLRAPALEFSTAERAAIVEFVHGGGSLLLVLDQEQRQSLAKTGVNDLIAPFGLQLTPDTEYLHNCGAIAKSGVINKSDRELPYSGGRAVIGGTAFAWRLDREGKFAEPFAAYSQIGPARIIVLGEGMATLHLGTPEGERLSGIPNDPVHTKYWGADSATFMTEVLSWLTE